MGRAFTPRCGRHHHPLPHPPVAQHRGCPREALVPWEAPLPSVSGTVTPLGASCEWNPAVFVLSVTGLLHSAVSSRAICTPFPGLLEVTPYKSSDPGLGFSAATPWPLGAGTSQEPAGPDLYSRQSGQGGRGARGAWGPPAWKTGSRTPACVPLQTLPVPRGPGKSKASAHCDIWVSGASTPRAWPREQGGGLLGAPVTRALPSPRVSQVSRARPEVGRVGPRANQGGATGLWPLRAGLEAPSVCRLGRPHAGPPGAS